MSLLKSKCKTCNKEFFPRHNFKCSCCQEFIGNDICLKCHNKNDRASPAKRYNVTPYMRFTLFTFTVLVSYLLIIKGSIPT